MFGHCVDVVKCRRSFHKFTLYTHFLSVTENDLSWLNNLFMVMFQLMRMSSYAKNKLQMCSAPNISVDVANCGESFHKFALYTHILSVTNNDLSWLNSLFMVIFQLIMMSSYAKKNLLMYSVSQHQCRRRQMLGIFHKFTLYTHFLSLTKNDLSWLNDLFMVMFQLIRMSSYVKNKLLIRSFTQHQCRCRQMWGNFSQSYTHFLSVAKNDLSWLNNLFMVRFQLISCPLMLRTKYKCVRSLCRCRQMSSKFSQIHTVHSLLSVTENKLSWLKTSVVCS